MAIEVYLPATDTFIIEGYHFRGMDAAQTYLQNRVGLNRAESLEFLNDMISTAERLRSK